MKALRSPGEQEGGTTRFPETVWRGFFRKSRAQLLSVFAVFLIASGCSRIEFDNVPLSVVVQRPRTLRCVRTLPGHSRLLTYNFGDYDGDGYDEIVSIQNHAQDEKGLSLAQFMTNDFQAVSSLNDSGSWNHVGFLDVDGDGEKEVALALNLHDSLLVGVVPFVPCETCRGVGFFLGDPVSLTGSKNVHPAFGYGRVLPRFRNGYPAILQTVITPWTDAPRHVFVICLDDSSKFDIPMGGMVISHCVADVNSDGRNELLVGTYAPANGAEANGMGDWLSWLVVISDSGRILCKQKMGLYNSKVYLSPEPLIRPGEPPSVLIARPLNGVKRNEPDFVGRWSWNSREQFPKLTFKAGLLDRPPLFYRDPYTGKQHVVVATHDHRLVNVDEDLKIVCSRSTSFAKHPEGLTSVLAADLTGDMRPELVFSDGEHSYFLSTDFHLLAHLNGNTLRDVFHVGKNRRPLVCYRDKEQYFHLARLQWNPVYYGVRVGGLLLLILIVAGPPWVVRRIRRKAARQRLARTNAFRAWALEAMDTGTVIFDAAGKLVSINRKAREMLGLLDSVSGTINGFAKQLRGSGAERVADLLRELDKRRLDRIELEFAAKRPSGSQLWLVTVERLRDSEGRAVGKAVALRDVTETVRYQQVMSWVNLARRLAHEVKTPIASILLAAEKIKRFVETHLPGAEKKLGTYFDLMFREIERTRDLAETMMQVTDLERSQREPVDVNSVVREAVELLAPQVPPGVDLEVALDEELPPVLGSRAQIGLAITNVLKNSLQALDGDGKVSIRTFVAHGLQKAGCSDGQHVAVEIADTGAGIPEEVKDRVFEPYFSNKHSGTGLGLAIVKTVVDEHKGCVEFESTQGVGTTFWLYFPVGPDGREEALSENEPKQRKT